MVGSSRGKKEVGPDGRLVEKAGFGHESIF